MQKQERRRRYFCDSTVQGALLRQLVSYWLLGSIAVVVLTTSYQIAPLLLAGETDVFRHVWGQLGPMLLISAMIAPIILRSAVRFSNRFVGPMLRFRRALKELANGETPSAITLREYDYWPDVASDINVVVARLANQEENHREHDAATHDEPPQSTVSGGAGFQHV